MKTFYFFIISVFFYTKAVANDSTFFTCKYRYTFQKDSAFFATKYNDIMILSIKDKSSIFYSYLRHFGARKIEEKMGKDTEGTEISGNLVSIDASKRKEYYFTQNESEVIEIDFLKNNIIVTDQLLLTAYGYTDNLQVPKWKIGLATITLLGQKCQIATTTYKGRNYTAWFSIRIPLPYGPWLFNGLPGLILKVSDDKEQFIFECMELNTPIGNTKVFKPYTNIQYTTKKKLQANKKLLAQNPLEYVTGIEGKAVIITDANGQPVNMPSKPNKPYNPIDLTQ